MRPDSDWLVGGSNDETHHWFLFRYLPGGGYEVRGKDGVAVQRRDGGYTVYRTKKAAAEALKGLKK